MPDKTDRKDDQKPNEPVSDAPVSDASGTSSAGVSDNDTSDASSREATATAADATANAVSDEVLTRVIEKVDDADSILVVLSKDPSVDEMSAAIALTISLDRMGKHATAIYSGKTPNALEFLEPEKTFETNTNSLQDFIIALDKEKADHLRYKIEGDYVKVYITPYRTTISEDDLEFSHGEVNVDMVISFNVPTPEDLDAALAQHGRIMHDAVSINISNKIPGRLGGVEWNDPMASSVSEMVLKFLKAENQDIEKDVATALLTGIIAETERFSNDKTTPDTMAASAELMQKGADQQIVVSHIEELKQPVPETPAEEPKQLEKQPEPGSIDVSHEDDKVETPEVSTTPEASEAPVIAVASEAPEAPVAAVAPEVPVAPEPDVAPTEGTEVATSENLANVPVDAGSVNNTISPEAQLEQMIAEPAPTVSAPVSEPISMPKPVSAPEPVSMPKPVSAPEPVSTPEPTLAPEPQTPMMGEVSNPIINAVPTVANVPEAPSADIANLGMGNIPASGTEVAAVPTAAVPVEQIYSTPNDTVDMSDGVLNPVEEEQPKDYGAMMEQELANAIPVAPTMPEVQPIVPVAPASPDAELPPPPAPQTAYDVMPPMGVSAEPTVAQTPVATGPAPTATGQMPAEAMAAPVMPEPTVAAPVMPEPAMPAPAQDSSDALGIPEAPEGVAPPPEPVNPVVVQPIQDPASVPPVQDPGSFKIPGM